MQYLGNSDKYPPSWYQILPADKRFVLVMNDEAVLDKETGLVWERSPSTYKFNWVEAIYTANNKIIGSRKGWRLPAVEELATLVDPSQQSPSIPASSPFIDIQSDMYWSASVYTLAPAGIAQGVHFTDGTVANVANKSNTYYIWCVRGGYGYNN